MTRVESTMNSGLATGTFLLTLILWTAAAAAEVIRVPEDASTVQGAIDAAVDGDTVLIAPGTYREYLEIEDKGITLASLFLTTGDASYVERTILDGGQRENGIERELIRVDEDAGPNTRIIGLTLQNAEDGIVPEVMLQILHNRFRDIGSDAIDFEDSGGLCAYNDFENVGDDAIDLDGACAGIFEHNRIVNMENDGIEIRLHDYDGPHLTVIIRNNVILGSEEDGIQIIDYPGESPRTYWIENNVIAGSVMAGIGCMPDGITREDYTAHALPERVYVLNNTIVENEYGITGGGNFVLLNNIIAGNRQTGLLNMTGDSVAGRNLFWNNGLDIEGSNIEEGMAVFADPQLGAHFEPAAGGPAVDAGVAVFTWPGGVVARPTASFTGSAPDLGAIEAGE